jgi:hypothetical protein
MGIGLSAAVLVKMSDEMWSIYGGSMVTFQKPQACNGLRLILGSRLGKSAEF